MRVLITLRLGNVGMQEPADVAEALRKLADRMERLDNMDSLPLPVRDQNGNCVGECHLALARKL